MIRAVLIDDEKHATDTLEWEIRRSLPTIEIVGVFNDPLEAREFIVNNPPELMFLDIEMPGMNGLELLKSIGELRSEVIFTTAYDQFALQALKLAAVDYILKPVIKDDLIDAFERYSKRRSQNNQPSGDELLSKLRYASQMKRMPIPAAGSVELVPQDAVVRCESASNYTTLFFVDGKKMLLTKTLKEIETIFRQYGFYRVHASHLVNVNHIERFVKADGGYLEMSDGSHVSVSRTYRDALMQLLMNG